MKTRCRQNTNLPLEALLLRLNPVLRGWTAHFRPGVSAIAFGYLRAFTWRQVIGWLRRKHPGITWKDLRRRFFAGGWWPADGEVILFNPGAVRPPATATGARRSPRRGRAPHEHPRSPAGLVESRMRRRGARPVRRAARGNGPVETPAPRPGPTPTTSTSACRRTSCACWCSSGSAPTAARSSSRWPTATGSRPSPGRTCCATPPAAGCAPRSSRSVTARSGSGAPCARCSPRPGSSAAGSTRSNVLAALPKSAHPGAKKALAEIWNAEDRRHALDAVARRSRPPTGRSSARRRREDHR